METFVSQDWWLRLWMNTEFGGGDKKIDRQRNRQTKCGNYVWGQKLLMMNGQTDA